MECFRDNGLLLYRLEHQRMHEEHKGHDAMHAEMIVILLVTLIVAQVALVEWKKRHYKSFSVSFVIKNLLLRVQFYEECLF